jgi:hypothetical protein
LDPDRRRTVGSTGGIVYRDLVRKDPRIWARGSRDCEKGISQQLEDSVGHSRVSEWNIGGMKPLGPRHEKSRSIGIRIHESRSTESRGSCGRMAENKVGLRGRWVDTHWLEVESAFC